LHFIDTMHAIMLGPRLAEPVEKNAAVMFIAIEKHRGPAFGAFSLISDRAIDIGLTAFPCQAELSG